MTTEYVFLRQALELDLKLDSDALCHWFLSEQKPDGSWSLAPGDCPGDISITTEVYLALKILGISSDAAPMQRARKFIIAQGGVEKVRNLTRIYLATFGLFPWKNTPIESIPTPGTEQTITSLTTKGITSPANNNETMTRTLCSSSPFFSLPTVHTPNF